MHRKPHVPPAWFKKSEKRGTLHGHEPSILLCQTPKIASLQSRAEQKGVSLSVLWPLAYCWSFCIFNSESERLWV